MKRFLTGLIAIAALAFSAGLGRASTAGAVDEWCWEDPVLSINGTEVHVDVGMAVENLVKLTGPVEVVVVLPQTVPASVLFVDQTFFSEHVMVVRSSEVWKRGQPIPVTVSVFVPASADFKVGLRITAVSDGVSQLIVAQKGMSNQLISAIFSLSAKVSHRGPK